MFKLNASVGESTPVQWSKSVWLAIATTVLGLVATLQEQSWIQDNPQFVAVVLMAIGVLQAIIRFLTKGPVMMSRRP